MENLVRNLELKPGAAEDSIQLLQKEYNLPKDILDFLRFSNGAEGSIGNTYLSLWSAEEIPMLNEAYRVIEFAPGLVIFGSDGGNTAYAYNKIAKVIVKVPFVGMSLQEVNQISNSLKDFFDYLLKLS